MENEKTTKLSRPFWAIAIAGAMLLALGSWLTFAKPKFAFVDFGDYYYASLLVRQAKDPYDGKEADQLAKEDGFEYIKGSDYIYPLVLAVVITPITVFQPRMAAALWFLVSAFLLLISILSLVRYAYPQASKRKAGMLILAGTFFAPAFYTLYVGQVNAILLACIVFALGAMLQRKDRFSGVLVGLAAVIKLSPAALLLPVALRRRKRILMMSLGLLPVATLLITEAISPGSTARFFLDVGPSLWDFKPHHAHPVNQSIRGVMLRMFQENNWTTPYIALSPAKIGSLIKVVVAALGIGTCVVLWRSWLKENEQNRISRRYLEWGLVISVITIASPLGWESSFLLLLIPYAALLKQGYWKWVLASYLLMLVQRLGFDGFANKPQDWPTLAQNPAISSLGLISGLICIVCCIVALQKEKARTAE